MGSTTARIPQPLLTPLLSHFLDNRSQIAEYIVWILVSIPPLNALDYLPVRLNPIAAQSLVIHRTHHHQSWLALILNNDWLINIEQRPKVGVINSDCPHHLICSSVLADGMPEVYTATTRTP